MQLQPPSLLVVLSNFWMEVLLRIQLNTDKYLAPYNTYLSPALISHLWSINYHNLCIDHLLHISLWSNEIYDILKGHSIMAFFSARMLNSISCLC